MIPELAAWPPQSQAINYCSLKSYRVLKQITTEVMHEDLVGHQLCRANSQETKKKSIIVTTIAQVA